MGPNAIKITFCNASDNASGGDRRKETNEIVGNNTKKLLGEEEAVNWGERRDSLDRFDVMPHVVIITHAAYAVLIAEAGAAFDTATLEDGAAVFGGIALHEAVLGFALAFVGLVSAFGHNLSSYSFKIVKYLF